MKFLHTADWQLGKPFAGIRDADNRAKVREARFEAVRRIAAIAADRRVTAVLVAGDLFDSPTPDERTVSHACSVIGSIGCPVFAIPGNHDHGGPGSLWEERYFLEERDRLAPNLRVLLAPDPLRFDDWVLLPCPLLRRQSSSDPTAWIREVEDSAFGERPRIALAHGSIESFGGFEDEEEQAVGGNQIDLGRLADAPVDYLALGDWHGMKQVGPKAWYSGTPEPDRFRKGEDHRPGMALIVDAARGREPSVDPVATAQLGWHRIEEEFSEDAGVGRFAERLASLVGDRVGADLVRAELSGSLGLSAMAELDRLLEQWEARLLRLKLRRDLRVAPTPDELEALTTRACDPLLSQVARTLMERAHGEEESAETARIALRLLFSRIPEP